MLAARGIVGNPCHHTRRAFDAVRDELRTSPPALAGHFPLSPRPACLASPLCLCPLRPRCWLPANSPRPSPHLGIIVVIPIIDSSSSITTTITTSTSTTPTSTPTSASTPCSSVAILQTTNTMSYNHRLPQKFDPTPKKHHGWTFIIFLFGIVLPPIGQYLLCSIRSSRYPLHVTDVHDLSRICLATFYVEHSRRDEVRNRR